MTEKTLNDELEDELITTCVEEFIETTCQILFELNDQLKLMQDLTNQFKAAKTSGTAMSILGATIITGSILAAPFTGGTSVIAATGFGTIISGGGGLVNVSDEVVDMVFSANKMKQIELICEKRKCVADRLARYLDKINANSIKLENMGFETFDAFSMAMLVANKGSFYLEKRNTNFF